MGNASAIPLDTFVGMLRKNSLQILLEAGARPNLTPI